MCLQNDRARAAELDQALTPACFFAGEALGKPLHPLILWHLILIVSIDKRAMLKFSCVRLLQRLRWWRASMRPARASGRRCSRPRAPARHASSDALSFEDALSISIVLLVMLTFFSLFFNGRSSDVNTHGFVHYKVGKDGSVFSRRSGSPGALPKVKHVRRCSSICPRSLVLCQSEVRLLCKWRGLSHRHLSWESAAALLLALGTRARVRPNS